MRLLMLETRRGTEDGFTIRQYLAGQEYEIAEGLARAFLAAGCACIAPVKKKTATRKSARKKKTTSPPVVVHRKAKLLVETPS